jgi:hypothetical protein
MVGSVLGGAVGFALMWHPWVATSPHVLAATLCVAAFAVGLLGSSNFRVTITLTLVGRASRC